MVLTRELAMDRASKGSYGKQTPTVFHIANLMSKSSKERLFVEQAAELLPNQESLSQEVMLSHPKF